MKLLKEWLKSMVKRWNYWGRRD